MADDEYDLWDTLNLQPGASLEEVFQPTGPGGKLLFSLEEKSIWDGVFVWENEGILLQEYVW